MKQWDVCGSHCLEFHFYFYAGACLAPDVCSGFVTSGYKTAFPAAKAKRPSLSGQPFLGIAPDKQENPS